MAIDKKEMGGWIHSGRGSVSEKVAKSDKEVLAYESEENMDDAIPDQKGDRVNDSGGKPDFATGEKPFHMGRGNGRGMTDSKV